MLFSVQDPSTRSGVHLVSGEGVKVAVNRLYISRNMYDALGPVNKYEGSIFMAKTGDFFDRVDNAEDVRYLGYAAESGFRSEQFRQGRKHELASVVYR